MNSYIDHELKALASKAYIYYLNALKKEDDSVNRIELVLDDDEYVTKQKKLADLLTKTLKVEICSKITIRKYSDFLSSGRGVREFTFLSATIYRKKAEALKFDLNRLENQIKEYDDLYKEAMKDFK